MGGFTFLLDFLWKLLIVTCLGSTFIFGSFLVARIFFGKVSAGFFNRLAQYSVASLLGLTIVAGFILSIADKDLQVQCFGSFVESQGGFGITRALGLVWLFGGIILFLKDVVSIQNFKKQLAHYSLSETSEYLLVSNQLSAMTYGVLNPIILIPQAVAENSSRLKYVLLHEKTHIKNHDGLWSFVALLAVRICWFNPLSFLFEKNRILAMEMATDEETISSHQLNPTSYAESLIATLGIGSSRPNNQVSISAASHFAQLRFRIEQMHPRMKSERRSLYKWIVLGLMSLGWIMGISEALASIRINKPAVTNEVMCYQVQHEKIIENWFHIEKEANKCE